MSQPATGEWDSPGAIFRTVKSRVQNNVGGSLSKMTMEDGIRLVIILGAYALLRPYLIKLGGYFQAKDHERAMSEYEVSSPAATGKKANPNSLRGLVDVPSDSDDEQDPAAAATSVETKGWGSDARKRQRHFIKRMIEEEEKRLAEEDSDEDIKEYLVE